MDIHSKDSSHDHSSISKQGEVVIITVPFPCHSHLNQLLHLSCLISSSYNIPVHYATTSTHLRQVKHRFNDTTHLQNSQLHFHEFPTPDFLSPSPTPNPSNKFPTHLQPSFDSSIHLRQPMAALLQNISATARKVIVIHDVMMAYVVQDIANVPNAKSYAFTATCSFSSFFDWWQMMGKPLLEKPPPKGLPSIEGCYPTELLNLVARSIDFLKFTTGHIYNSCKSIEDILKVGLPVNTWEQREETVTSSTIAKVVQNLIASKKGEEIRKRAEELGASTRQAVEEGGVSRMELDSFIAHITSHLNQLLHLSCLISSSYNIPVHYATASTHLRQAKHRFNNKTHLQNSQLHFHEFPTPDFVSPSPTPNPSTKFPTHLQPSFESSIHLRQPMAVLLQSIFATARKVIVIHDVLMAYAVQDIANVPNAESYAFSPTSPFSSFFDWWQMKGKPSLEKPPPKGLPSIEGCFSTEILHLIALQIDFLKFTTGYIYNSCRSVEGTYIDLIANDQFNRNKLIWSIGPLNLGADYDRRNSNTPKDKCLEWLDKQAPKSVLYVSFGTTTTMTDEEIKELATGLEQSEQKFIWVFREADKGDIFTGEVTKEKLPEGFEERVKEVGMVVRDWAPQVEILGHPSTGGFMSHCGWNSCFESITMGVPIAAWPMHSDQPKNAFLVTDILKVGLPVKTWEQRDEIVTSSTIAKAVQKLIASKEGEEIRKRAEELGASTRQAVEEGGVSRMELDSFIAHITSSFLSCFLYGEASIISVKHFFVQTVREGKNYPDALAKRRVEELEQLVI
ncbi:hypothetical protein RHSIM_Rhsim04G0105900 [Rhododendron simsii]|uniref:Glycosyltransferase N-terminal domain-containing protein n=1 Tax=Rhododendron simsii TaxID=118357 RepID=A0A834HA63_RHOSS|nr:hypothetical protein RHSIM_Rhsim04G0105900 [Rhododendron simsii]